MHEEPLPDDTVLLSRMGDLRQQLFRELGKVIVGQGEMLELVLVCLLCRGHCLLEGVPGLAKTLTISTLARVLGLVFSRVQFTPDLMPSDILGTDVLEEDKKTGERQFRFISGPIFANLVLADEINRTPPKTQAALLEAMQERQVSAGGEIRPLPRPFFVLATQNPIEQEGTYPLPEAQLDRFMFNVILGYPSREDEFMILKQGASGHRPELAPLPDAARDLLTMQKLVERVPVADPVIEYASDLVRATRPGAGTAPAFVKEYVAWGAGPRAGLALLLGAKGRAALAGRPAASVDDVKALAVPVLRHRLVLNFKADADNVRKDELIVRLASEIRR
ncbi:MAG: AAA family ATPase [Candidatus Riflebacteria bacterium]|nr:AAA family ATPase [Candidatus Riflebacteria bacterium]